MPYWLLRYQPKAVYIRACFLAFLMRLICRLAGVPLIMEVDAIVDKEAEMRGQQKILVRMLKVLDKFNYRFADGVVCVTDGLRQEVIRRGANSKTTIVIHNASRTDVMQPFEQRQARCQLELAENGFIIGFTGTFAPWQGLDLLVQAAKEVVENLPQPVRFILVGEGQCRDQLEEMVEGLGLKRFFSFLTMVPYQQVAVFNSACDIVVIPIYDPRKLRFGLSPLKFWDAVSVGVPVLVPCGCGLEDVLEQLGLPGIFRPGDKKHLSQAILNVLAQTKYHQSRRKEVHEIVTEQYDWTRAAQKLLELCSKLCRGTQVQ